MSTFAPADPSSTGSESTAPSTASQEASSEASEAETADTHDPNTTWGPDDPLNPNYVAPESSS